MSAADGPDALLPTRRVIPENWVRPLPLDRWFPEGASPLEVDVGCGKGRFLLARARRHPECRYLGIERMLGRLRKIDRKACRLGLANLRLLRLDAWYAVAYLMPAASVRTYYVFFPDPWPKARHAVHRFFDEGFAAGLHRSLEPGGVVHAATDHAPYFEAIEAALRVHGGFEPAPVLVPDEEEQTDFERLYLGRVPIGRCAFRKR